jgi:CheY-like chemotaxis protein
MATIMVIEDNRAIRENTAEFLAIEGFDVLMAIDGQDGLDKIKLHRPDLIVCDIIMPKMDGYQLLAKLGKKSISNRFR